MNWAQPPENDDTPFYSSGTFWSIVAVVVAIIAIGVGVWAAWRSANPKRQLNIWIESDTPLMTTTTAGIEVSFKGTRLRNPHLVRVQIVARGRKDIVPADFTGPVHIHLATRILRVINTESTTKRANLPHPVITTEDTDLVMTPAILPGDQRITLDLLLDATPKLTLTAPLANINVTTNPENPTQVNWVYPALTAISLATLATLAFFDG